MQKARWSEWFAGPPLELAVRQELAERIVRFSVAPLWLAMLPSLIVAGALLRVSVYMRSSQWLLAAAWLGWTMLAAIVVGVLFNSVHAPIYGGGLVLLAFVIPLFGAGWGLATSRALRRPARATATALPSLRMVTGKIATAAGT